MAALYINTTCISSCFLKQHKKDSSLPFIQQCFSVPDVQDGAVCWVAKRNCIRSLEKTRATIIIRANSPSSTLGVRNFLFNLALLAACQSPGVTITSAERGGGMTSADRALWCSKINWCAVEPKPGFCRHQLHEQFNHGKLTSTADLVDFCSTLHQHFKTPDCASLPAPHVWLRMTIRCEAGIHGLTEIALWAKFGLKA